MQSCGWLFLLYSPISLSLHAGPDRPALHAPGTVESLQEVVLEVLSQLCVSQARETCSGPQHFGRLLGRLTELRTLRHNHLLLLRQQP